MQRRRKVWVGLVGLLVAGWLGWRWFDDWMNQDIGVLLAVDTNRGEVAWITPLSQRQVIRISSPTIANGRVFLGLSTVASSTINRSEPTSDYKLLAFDTRSGQQLWQFTPTKRQFGALDEAERMALVPPYASSNQLYANVSPKTGLSRLIALDAATGKLNWVIERSWFSWQNLGIVAVGDRLIVASENTNSSIILSSRDSQTAKTQWQVNVNNEPVAGNADILPRTLLSNDRTIILTIPAKLWESGISTYAYDIETGNPRFTSKFDSSFRLQQLVNSTLYEADWKTLQAVDALTGLSRWTVELNALCEVPSDLEADSKSVYLFCNRVNDSSSGDRWFVEGWILKIDAQTGETLWQQKVQRGGFWTSSIERHVAVLNNSSIFVITLGGRLSDGSDISEMLALSAHDGSVLWRFPVFEYFGRGGLVTDGTTLFTTGWLPRWCYWKLRTGGLCVSL